MRVIFIEAKQNKKIFFTFDDNPYEFLDGIAITNEKDLLAQLKIIAGAAWPEFNRKVTYNDLLDYHMRLHLLLRGRDADGALDVICIYDDHSIALKLPISAVSPEMMVAMKPGNENDIPDFFAKMLPFITAKRADLQAEKDQKQEKQQHEKFLRDGPEQMPAPIALPQLPDINRMKEEIEASHDTPKKILSLLAVMKLSPSYKDFQSRIEQMEKVLEMLALQIQKLTLRMEKIEQLIQDDQRISIFIETNWKNQQRDLIKRIKYLANLIVSARSATHDAEHTLSKDLRPKYFNFQQRKLALDFAQKIVLAGLYNAAIEYYQTILATDKNERAAKINEFNSVFAGIANIDNVGHIAPTFWVPSLQQVKQIVDNTLEACAGRLLWFISSTKMKLIQKHLAETAVVCKKAFREFYGQNIMNLKLCYANDVEEAFIFDAKSFSWNIKLDEPIDIFCGDAQACFNAAWKSLNAQYDELHQQQQQLYDLENDIDIFYLSVTERVSLLKLQDDAEMAFRRIKMLATELTTIKSELALLIQIERIPANLIMDHQLLFASLGRLSLTEYSGEIKDATTLLENINKLEAPTPSAHNDLLTLQALQQRMQQQLHEFRQQKQTIIDFRGLIEKESERIRLLQQREAEVRQPVADEREPLLAPQKKSHADLSIQANEIDYVELIKHIKRYIYQHTWQSQGFLCRVYATNLAGGDQPKYLPQHVHAQWQLLEAAEEETNAADARALYNEICNKALEAMGNPNSRRLPGTSKYYAQFLANKIEVYNFFVGRAKEPRLKTS